MDIFGALKAELRRSSAPIDDFDLLIGATAFTLGYRVVTNNERHYDRISGLGGDQLVKMSCRLVSFYSAVLFCAPTAWSESRGIHGRLWMGLLAGFDGVHKSHISTEKHNYEQQQTDLAKEAT